MTKKYLYANGDSFVAGMEALGDNDRRHENRFFAFPKIVGAALGHTEYINNALNGAGNEYIARSTLFDLLELENQGVKPEDVFVIIGWSTLFRLQLDRDTWVDELPLPREALSTLNDTAPFFINPNSGHWLDYNGKRYDTTESVNPFCVKYLWHHSLQNPQTEANIIFLNHYLKTKGYRYLFVNSCGMFDLTMIKPPINFYKNLKETFHAWGIKHYPEHKREFNHFDFTVHEEYARVLLEYIEVNKL
jgi:hypothetical protein